MNVVEMPIAELAPAAYNPRKALKAGDPEYAKLRRSIEAFGLVDPLIWNSRTKRVVGGHQRLTVLRDLGHETAPAVVVDLDEAREKALNLALNRIAGEWDEAMLAEVLKDLERSGDITLTGFDPNEIDELLRAYADDDPGEDQTVPEPPATPITQRGDLYELGHHRLLCGDSTVPADLERLIGKRQARTMWTDPPYGVDYTGGSGLTIANDQEPVTGALLRDAFAAVNPHLIKGAAIYVASPAGRPGVTFALAFMGAGWLLHQSLVWVKNSLVVGHSDYQHQHELVLYGWKRGAEREWWGGRDRTTVFDDEPKLEKLGKNELIELVRALRAERQSDVLREKRPSQSAVHPTMKPVPLVRRMLENSSGRGELVLDIFAGSGTTLIAAQQLGRHCYAMELDPRYCDVTVERWRQLTHQEPRRIAAAEAA